MCSTTIALLEMLNDLFLGFYGTLDRIFIFFVLGNDFFFYLCKVICEDVKVTSSA